MPEEKLRTTEPVIVNERWFGATPLYTDAQLAEVNANQNRELGGTPGCGDMAETLSDFAHDVERALDKLGPPYSYTRTFAHPLTGKYAACIPYFVRVDKLESGNPSRSWFVPGANSPIKHHVDMFLPKGCPKGSTTCRIGVQAKFAYNTIKRAPTPASETQMITVPIGQRGSDEWNSAVDKGAKIVQGLFVIPEVQSIFTGTSSRYVRARQQPKLYLEELRTSNEPEYHKKSACFHSKQGDLRLKSGDAERAQVYYMEQQMHLRAINERVPDAEVRRRRAETTLAHRRKEREVDEQAARLAAGAAGKRTSKEPETAPVAKRHAVRAGDDRCTIS